MPGSADGQRGPAARVDSPWGARLTRAGDLLPAEAPATFPSGETGDQPRHVPRLVLLALLLVVAALATAAGLRWLTQPSFVPVAERLSGKELSRAVAELDSRGVPYRLDRSGTRLSVPQHHADAAAAFLGPAAGPVTSDSSRDLANPAQVMLDRIYGPGRTSVRLAVERNNDASSFTRRDVDTAPGSRVAVSSESTRERFRQGELSELSRTDGACPDLRELGSEVQYCKATERNSYATSESHTSGTRSPGAVSRMTVAVAVDSRLRPAPDLEALRRTVAAAVGADSGRGDSITVVATRFPGDPRAAAQTPVSSSGMSIDDNVAALAAAALLLAITVLLAIPACRRRHADPQRELDRPAT